MGCARVVNGILMGRGQMRATDPAEEVYTGRGRRGLYTVEGVLYRPGVTSIPGADLAGFLVCPLYRSGEGRGGSIQVRARGFYTGRGGLESRA